MVVLKSRTAAALLNHHCTRPTCNWTSALSSSANPKQRKGGCTHVSHRVSHLKCCVCVCVCFCTVSLHTASLDKKVKRIGFFTLIYTQLSSPPASNQNTWHNCRLDPCMHTQHSYLLSSDRGVDSEVRCSVWSGLLLEGQTQS